MAITVGVNWVGNGIVSYYLSPVLKSVGVTKAVEITGINAGLAFWNLVIAMFAGLNVERFGRRPLFLISTAGMIISYAFVMGFSAGFATTGKAALGVAAIPFLFLFYGSYDIAWTPVRATSQIFFETPADIF
jgi:MFS family permease